MAYVSYLALEKEHEALKEQFEQAIEAITELKDKNAELLKDKHNLFHRLLRLMAAKHPDICEHFTDCDPSVECALHSGSCVSPDSELRKGCTSYKGFKENEKKALKVIEENEKVALNA